MVRCGVLLGHEPDEIELEFHPLILLPCQLGRKESGKHFLWHGYGEDRSRKSHNGIVYVQK
jgi:hypothetical protein